MKCSWCGEEFKPGETVSELWFSSYEPGMGERHPLKFHDGAAEPFCRNRAIQAIEAAVKGRIKAREEKRDAPALSPGNPFNFRFDGSSAHWVPFIKFDRTFEERALAVLEDLVASHHVSGAAAKFAETKNGEKP